MTFESRIIERLSEGEQIIDRSSMQNQTRYVGDKVIVDCNVLPSLDANDYGFAWLLWKNEIDEKLVYQIINGDVFPGSIEEKVTLMTSMDNRTQHGSRILLQTDTVTSAYVTCLSFNFPRFDMASVFFKIVEEGKHLNIYFNSIKVKA